MSNQQRACELLRQAAQILEQESVSVNRTTASLCTDVSTPTTPTTAHSAALRLATRNLFTPYGSARGRTRMPPQPRVTFWSHRFCALARSDQDQAPTREEKQLLISSGLGEQKITFIKSSDPADFKAKIEERFPRLKGIGGYELLRCGISARVKLETLHIPPGGYTTQYLSDTGVLGQAVCFLRPIQKDLIVEDFPIEVPSDDIKESCFHCGEAILLRNLRSHVTECCERSTSTSSSRRHSVQVPVCQFACATPLPTPEVKSDSNTEIGLTEKCPICQKDFQKDLIEQHADMCAISTEKNSEPESRTIGEAFSDIFGQFTETWEISVVRRQFNETAMREIMDSLDEDWRKRIKIRFIGEDGIDQGGLTREFFSLLFKETTAFEGHLMSVYSDMLEKQQYFYIGKITAMALLTGHPGPRCLDNHLVEYILSGTMPSASSISLSSINRMDVLDAVQKIQTSNPDNRDQLTTTLGDLLQTAGFTRKLTEENSGEAVDALKSYFAFYRCLPPLLQFMKGLKLHGVLEILQKHKSDAKALLVKTIGTSASEVMDFFKPQYSTNDNEKATEEMIIYNLNQFLKNLERGRVTSISIDPERCTEETVTLDMGHILQAFIGCRHLPSQMTGLINFNHQSTDLSTVNTCIPAITFSNVKELVDYNKMEDLLLNIIIGSYGFGIV